MNLMRSNRFYLLNQARGMSNVSLPQCSFNPDQTQVNLPDQECQRIDQKLVSPLLKRYYKRPLLISQGHMQWVWDGQGKRYLDLFGGVATTSVGHCHPKLVESTRKQINKLWHVSSLYQTEEILEYSEKLLKTLPDSFDSVFFCNSGSEATELAILMARAHTGSNAVLSLQNGYHGVSSSGLGAVGLGVWKHNVVTGQGFHLIPNPDPYRGRFGSTKCRQTMDESFDSAQNSHSNCCVRPNEINSYTTDFGVECFACSEYLRDLDQVLNTHIPPNKLAALIMESIQGVGGTVQYPREYVRKAAEMARAQNGLVIMDEVQTGFGRTGLTFWGFQSHQVRPDIVTMAKGIGNGFPMAAVVSSRKIADSLTKSLYFNTFGGNPLACRVASTVLDIIKEEDLQANSLEVGRYFVQSMKQLQQKYSIIGDVRGLGLMLGVELVKEKGSLIPLEKHKLDAVMEKSLEHAMLIGRGGPFGSVIRIKPPMCINKSDVDYAIEAFDQIFKEVSNMK